ncbi:PRC-barrel domain-containing protein [Methylocaldum szegediense]|uniref:PRC-barrel domain protein n=1 Tax=Methylocaldum szegediense TaxID=73780 RepID=A0ABN8X013_9GAMM|nr:PRC-barrel domain-containing protein [Methylocaldum szegediense]CAI8738891.1 PRC-barrel domain protein [Methylocaldum szegediense]
MELKLMKMLILSVLFSLGVTGGAFAQGQEEAPVAGTTTIGVAVEQTDIVTKGWRVSKLLRQQVYNDNNQKIGKIEDFIVAPDGSLSVAIVDVGGFLGMGTHRVAIPVQQFNQVTPKIVLPGATKDSLKEVPEFRYSK